MREPPTLFGHTVEIRRAMQSRSKRFDVAVTEIVAEYYDEIRLLLIGPSRYIKPAKRRQKQADSDCARY